MKLLSGESGPSKEIFFALTLAYYVVLGFSVLFLFFCFYGLATSIVYLNYGKTAIGKVVSVKSETREEVETAGVSEDERPFRHTVTEYTQMIEFKASSGSTVRFSTTIEASRYQPGDEIPVIYLEDQPENAKIKTFTSLWGGHLFFLFLGLVCYGVSWFFKYLRYLFQLQLSDSPLTDLPDRGNQFIEICAATLVDRVCTIIHW
jgi:hypothetical protein